MREIQTSFDLSEPPIAQEAPGGIASCSHTANPSRTGDLVLLASLLETTLPHPKTQEVTKTLIRRFGCLNSVLAANPSELMLVSGVTDHVIRMLKLAEAIGHRMAKARIMERDVISSWEELTNYCRIKMGALATEQFHVLFLDTKNALIADELLGKGTVDHVPVYPREVLKRALELHASALVLVHNHPSGDPTPSDCDQEMTKRICRGAAALGLRVHDHVVITRTTNFSFRAEGLI